MKNKQKLLSTNNPTHSIYQCICMLYFIWHQLLPSLSTLYTK